MSLLVSPRGAEGGVGANFLGTAVRGNVASADRGLGKVTRGNYLCGRGSLDDYLGGYRVRHVGLICGGRRPLRDVAADEVAGWGEGKPSLHRQAAGRMRWVVASVNAATRMATRVVMRPQAERSGARSCR